MKYIETILSSDYIELLEFKLKMHSKGFIALSDEEDEFISNKIEEIRTLESNLADGDGFPEINHENLFK